MQTNASQIRIQVLLFAGARSVIGQDWIEVELPYEGTVAALRHELSRQYPLLAELIRRSRFAIDSEFVADEKVLDRPLEVAWIPPVSGG